MYENISISRNIANPLFHDTTDNQHMDSIYFQTQNNTFPINPNDPTFTSSIYVSYEHMDDNTDERWSHGSISSGQESAHTGNASLENPIQVPGSVKHPPTMRGEVSEQGVDTKEGNLDSIVFYEDNVLTTSRKGYSSNSVVKRTRNPNYSSSDLHGYESAQMAFANSWGYGIGLYVTNDYFLVPEGTSALYLSVD